MIKGLHSWILNHKGLTVHSKTEDTIRIKYKESDYKWSDLLLDIYASSSDQSSTGTGLNPVELSNNYTFTPETAVYQKWSGGDMFIIASPKGTGISTIEEEVIRLIELRKAMKEQFLGIVFSDWLDDQGPVPVYNSSPLDEATSMQMAAHSLSMAAMGQKELPSHVIGPIPVPGSSVYQSLVYTFTRQVNDSQDPRIQLGGRPGTLFLIFKMEKIDKEVLDFIEGFLVQWKEEADVSESGLENLAESLCMTITLAWDLLKYQEEQNVYLRELVTRYYSELILLRQENLSLRMKLREPGKKGNT
ncbi:MAG: hypothetical protein ACFFD4_16910 [Candidatus Odinarchaeota archaeon]